MEKKDLEFERETEVFTDAPEREKEKEKEKGKEERDYRAEILEVIRSGIGPEALREELADTTVILIAQRIASVRDADRIAVIEDGEINYCAPHDELMQTCETYRDIYASQMERGGAANE